MKGAMLMLVYAAILGIVGLVTYNMAPPGASAVTALAVPGACAVVMLVIAGIVVLAGADKPMLARRAHWIATVLVAVFALAFLSRAIPTWGAVGEFETAQNEYRAMLEQGELEDTDEARESFYTQRDAPDHSKQYLAAALSGLTIVSAIAFVALLLTRPSDRKTLSESAAEPPPSEPQSGTGG